MPYNKEKKAGYNKAYYVKNKEALNNKTIAFLCTEKGFISRLYTSCKRRAKERQSEDPSIEDFNLSKEDFLNIWEEHKAKYGLTCGYTGETILMQRNIARKDGVINKPPENLLSVDRLDPEIGYTKKNIVFCSWAFNARKKNAKIKDCYLIIKKHEERNQ